MMTLSGSFQLLTRSNFRLLPFSVARLGSVSRSGNAFDAGPSHFIRARPPDVEWVANEIIAIRPQAHGGAGHPTASAGFYGDHVGKINGKATGMRAVCFGAVAQLRAVHKPPVHLEP